MIVSIARVLSMLRYNYQGVRFDAGELSEGFWVKATSLDGRWSWERRRMTSAGAVSVFARAALEEFYGA